MRGRRVQTPAEKRQRNRTWDRQKRGGRGYDGVSDERIYRRDKWVCLMPECLHTDDEGRPDRAIDQALQGTGDVWAPSVDHVIPLRDGGLDNARNKRAAHQRCNNNANEQDQQDLVAAGGGSRQPVPLTQAIGDVLAAGDTRVGTALAALEELRRALGGNGFTGR